MNRTKRIKTILESHFSDFAINILDNSHKHKGHNNFSGEDETHIMVVLGIKAQSKIDRMHIHKKINILLKEEFNQGLHSLQIIINLLD